MDVQPTHVAVKILKGQKEKVFFHNVKGPDGKTIKMQLRVPCPAGEIKHYEQGVNVAQAVVVGKDVFFIKPGDMLLVDYSVDTDAYPSVWMESGERVVTINAINKFYEEDLIIPAETGSPEVYSHRKGDVEEVSTVFGVIKGNDIVPNWPYVILEYKVIDGAFQKTANGLLIPIDEGELVMRRVLFSHPDSPMKANEDVAVMYDSLFEREIDRQTISVCMDRDIYAKVDYS